MDIVVRNFFRLLRAGVFHRQEQVEPMSAWKWRQVWRLSMIHGVEDETWEGVRQLQDQYFMRLTDGPPPNLPPKGRLSAGRAPTKPPPEGEAFADEEEQYNPLTSRQRKRLADIAEDTNVRSATYRALVLTVEVANHLLKSGQWLHQLLALGRLLEAESHFIDAEQLDEWASEVGRGRMLQLEGLLLVQLLGVDADHVAFYTPSGNDKKDRRMVEDVAKAIWTTRPNIRFMKYFPQESLTSYTASVVQAIVNVKE
jgi:hypothetical protein